MQRQSVHHAVVVQLSHVPLSNPGSSPPCGRFGKDPMHWVQVGDAHVNVTEEGGQRVYRSTAVMTGLELSLFLEPALFDSRCAGFYLFPLSLPTDPCEGRSHRRQVTKACPNLKGEALRSSCPAVPVRPPLADLMP